MVLSPVSCPAKVHCTPIFALQNGKFSSLGVHELVTLQVQAGKELNRGKGGESLLELENLPILLTHIPISIMCNLTY